MITEPRTEAGRALLVFNGDNGATDFHDAYCLALAGKPCDCTLPEHIRAIEDEAARKERERIADILAAVNHSSGEVSACEGDEDVTWCDACHVDAVEFLAPDSGWAIVGEARDYRAAITEGSAS